MLNILGLSNKNIEAIEAAVMHDLNVFGELSGQDLQATVCRDVINISLPRLYIIMEDLRARDIVERRFETKVVFGQTVTLSRFRLNEEGSSGLDDASFNRW